MQKSAERERVACVEGAGFRGPTHGVTAMRSMTLFLFHMEGTEICAFSTEAAGNNIPVPFHGRPWKFLEKIEDLNVIGYSDELQLHGALAAVMKDGFHVFVGDLRGGGA
jgi:hypothetical protein